MTLSRIEIEQIAQAVVERLRDGSETHGSVLDNDGVARLLGCSVATVERLTRSGELPSYQVGRLRRYDRVAVLEAIKTNSRPKLRTEKERT